MISCIKSNLATNGGIDLQVTIGVVDGINSFSVRVDIKIGCVDVNSSARCQLPSCGADQIPIRPAKPISINNFTAVRKMRINS